MINRRYGNIINIVNYITVALISIFLILAMYFKISINVPQYMFLLLLVWCVLNMIIEIRRRSYGLIVLSIIYGIVVTVFLLV